MDSDLMACVAIRVNVVGRLRDEGAAVKTLIFIPCVMAMSSIVIPCFPLSFPRRRESMCLR
jgi:hypothetical protein